MDLELIEYNCILFLGSLTVQYLIILVTNVEITIHHI